MSANAPPVSNLSDAQARAIEVLSPSREAWRVFRSNKAAMVGLVILGFVVLVMAIGPGLYGVDPFAIVADPFTGPFENPVVWLGTDYLGRDILSGMVAGGRGTVIVGLSAALITVLIGVTIGSVAGFFGGWVDEVLMRITEFFQVLPSLLLAMVLVTLFSPSLLVVTIAIGSVSWPGTARLARAEFMRLRKLEYVSAARAMGAGNTRLILGEILPNALPPLIVSATLIIGVAILFEAGLSFLGLSDPNVMTWGQMIGNNRQYVLDAWWAVTFPGIGIFLTVLAVSLIGDGLNDAFNPKLHQR
ncbi:MAG: ABC transporter permease [Burkholderiaceae bacterium]